MIHSVLFVLDVPIEHGAIALQAEPMGRTRDLDPLAAVDLVVADDPAHALRENLGAAAGQGIDSRVDQPLDHFRVRKLAPPRQVGDLDHCERLQMDLGKTFFEAAKHLAIPVQRQLRMQPADDMKLGDRVRVAVSRRFPHLVERHGVGARVLGLFAERTETATRHADIGRIDVPVYVEVGYIAVQILAHEVGHVADSEQVRTAIESEAVFIIQPAPGENFIEDRLETLVVDYDFHVKPRSGEGGCRQPRNKRITR